VQANVRAIFREVAYLVGWTTKGFGKSALKGIIVGDLTHFPK